MYRILVVDDSRMIRKLVINSFLNLDIEIDYIFEASDGEEAIEKIKMDDLTHGKGGKRNYICRRCGAHYWNGKFYSIKEWQEYINNYNYKV